MSARGNILGKLRDSLAGTTPRPDEFDEQLVTKPWRYAPGDRLARLRSLMEAVHTEVHQCRSDNWPELVAELLNKRNLTNLLCAPAKNMAGRCRLTSRPRSRRSSYWLMISRWKPGKKSCSGMWRPA